MAQQVSRREFLSTSIGTLAGTLLLCDHGLAKATDVYPQTGKPSTSPATTIRAMTRTLDINGRAANAMGLLRADGTQGMSTVVNDPFQATLDNQLPVPTAIHWHGLHPPNNEDGVPGVTQLTIRPGASAFYNFPVQPAGTHWMHSPQGLQEAFLLAAPLIVHDSSDRTRDEQEVVIMLGDFSFTPPKEIYAQLQAGAKTNTETKQGQSGKATADKKSKAIKPDANDVNYDAYLANDRTLLDPEVVKVEKGGRVRLRIINGSSGTNYFVDLGALNWRSDCYRRNADRTYSCRSLSARHCAGD